MNGKIILEDTFETISDIKLEQAAKKNEILKVVKEVSVEEMIKLLFNPLFEYLFTNKYAEDLLYIRYSNKKDKFFINVFGFEYSNEKLLLDGETIIKMKIVEEEVEAINFLKAISNSKPNAWQLVQLRGEGE